MSNTTMAPRGLVGALAAAVEKEAPKPADSIEGYPYLVSLQSGLRFRRLAREEPEKLWRAWAHARKHDELLVWADDAATEARQISDIEFDASEPDSDPADPGAVTDAERGEPRD